MKTPASLLVGGLLLVSGMTCAHASVITVNVTGHVKSWMTYGNDPTHTDPLNNQLYGGEPVTASYTYDTATGAFQQWQYTPTMPPATAVVNIGPYSFQSTSSTPYYPGTAAPFQVGVFPPSQYGATLQLLVSSQLLQGGVPITSPSSSTLNFDFWDPNGQWPLDGNLPTGAPAMSTLASSTITIQYGSQFNSYITIGIDSVTLAPPSLEVSPATGNFAGRQHFDASLLLPAGVQVASAQASVGGTPVGNLSYPGGCTLMPNIVSRVALVCPDASQALSVGPNTVNWQVTLSDGTVLNQSVAWNLVQ
jgi:hypothetical protein